MQTDRHAETDTTKIIIAFHKSVIVSKTLKIRRHLHQRNIAKQNRVN